MQTKSLQKMKREWSATLFFVLLMAVGMMKGQAQVTIGDLIYRLDADNLTATVTGHKDGTNATGSLTIPSSVVYATRTYTVTAIGRRYYDSGWKGAFEGCSGLTGGLSIPNTITSIGINAFCYCSGFTGSLTISNSVTTIGESAFFGCSFTGNLTIPNSVTEIGDQAFNRCSGFTGDLTIPNSVTTIGDGAFAWCTGFTGDLTIPNSVTTIGDGAFA